MGNYKVRPAATGWWLILLCVVFLAACGSSDTGTLVKPDHSYSSFELCVNNDSFLDDGTAAFTLDVQQATTETIVTVRTENATGLKALYADITYDAAHYSPVEVQHADVLGGGSPVLSASILTESGVVHLGQVLACYQDSAGFTGESALVTVHFARRPATAGRAVATAPTSDKSATNLEWSDLEASELSWRYYNQGDYNQDGVVTVSDMTPLGQHYEEKGPFDPNSAVACIDGNNDGFITLNDITPIGANYGCMVTGYAVYGSLAADYPAGNTGGNGSAVQRGWVNFLAAEKPEGERLLFRFIVEEPRENEYYRVRPSNGISEGTPSTVVSNLAFGLLVTADVTGGEAPFLVSLAAEPVELSASEPIIYTWEIFDDVAPEADYPALGDPPYLSSLAAISPAVSNQPAVTVHIGNTAGEDGPMSYVARCTAVDALGRTAESLLLRITAEPNSTGLYYQVEHPQVAGELLFPIENDSGESANPVYQPYMLPEPWTGRANPAVATHPAGISFILGGEILDADGSFQRVVERGDSAYVYIPPVGGSATGEISIAKLNAASVGTMIRLNDWTGPAFPGSPASHFSPQWPQSDGDTRVPQVQDPENPPALPGPVRTLRSAPFTIVGSAAAVIVHERPETNPAGAYPDRGTSSMIMPPVVKDRDIQGMSEVNLWSWPSCVVEGWRGGSAYAGNMPGTGAPAVYVIGGRTSATGAVDLVQKYLPWGFGTEDLPPWSDTFGFQTTCNQVNIWSPYFLRPDTDQFPGETANFDPAVPDRLPDGTPGAEQVLPHLPLALYGLMATKLESGVDVPYPDFPNGPVNYIYVFGGIDASGTVVDDALIWDFTRPATPGGVDDLVFTALPAMPTPRAYGRAVLIPTDDLRIALVGGSGADGYPLNTIDIFTFDNIYSPTTGSWSTYAGTLPEALNACGAGYYPSATGDGIVAFGGMSVDAETDELLPSAIYPVPLSGAGEGSPIGLTFVPRSFAGVGQPGSYPLADLRDSIGLSPVSFDRYYVFGGLGVDGVTSAVEVFGLAPGPMN